MIFLPVWSHIFSSYRDLNLVCLRNGLDACGRLVTTHMTLSWERTFDHPNTYCTFKKEIDPTLFNSDFQVPTYIYIFDFSQGSDLPFPYRLTCDVCWIDLSSRFQTSKNTLKIRTIFYTSRTLKKIFHDTSHSFQTFQCAFFYRTRGNQHFVQVIRYCHKCDVMYGYLIRGNFQIIMCGKTESRVGCAYGIWPWQQEYYRFVMFFGANRWSLGLHAG